MAGLGLGGVFVFAIGGIFVFDLLFNIIKNSNVLGDNFVAGFSFLGFLFVGAGLWLIFQDKPKTKPTT